MNISSVLIIAKKEHQDKLLKEIKLIKDCSVELNENDKIIVIIESECLDDELKAYKSLEALKNIISINMVFSYQDLDEDIQKASEGKNLLEKLEKKENAKDIEYYGNIFQKY
ncbi:oxidoreductase [Campylobacter sp. MIT 12-8780]|uniref:chaperone NapD n=1 Tax=unclassified Campylobacter TaxID=2593542 RepID=UPI0010F5A6C2|nr:MULTISPECIES: chaperone NapD [unclassified Campylobacter]NDJ27891.1 oxidoreductase [Campylobacter sp. MIT 19-121]TKX28991.1 oxidoreductase [Campylobacter sp. MIT 12-5580]TQR40634.1 oxidoreductase [Campylobacter sp. MIT 12-8780]